MANLKKKDENVEVEVEVKEEKKATKKNNKVEVKEDVKEVEVEVEEVEVEVATENVTVPMANKPDGLVKIRMREDHKFNVGKDFYELKKGKTYTVPHSVKLRLNKAGLLLPL